MAVPSESSLAVHREAGWLVKKLPRRALLVYWVGRNAVAWGRGRVGEATVHPLNSLDSHLYECHASLWVLGVVGIVGIVAWTALGSSDRCHGQDILGQQDEEVRDYDVALRLERSSRGRVFRHKARDGNRTG